MDSHAELTQQCSSQKTRRDRQWEEGNRPKQGVFSYKPGSRFPFDDQLGHAYLVRGEIRGCDKTLTVAQTHGDFSGYVDRLAGFHASRSDGICPDKAARFKATLRARPS